MTRNVRAAGVTQEMEDFSNLRVECTHCQVRMTPHMGSGGQVRYFRCGSCQRWVSSTYAEVLRADTSFRSAAEAGGQPDERFEEVKDRLERWLAAVEAQDPCRVLGVSPVDPTDRIRSRYRELAMESHPDRGGSEDRMREINVAYERLDAHRKRRKAEEAARGTLTVTTRAREVVRVEPVAVLSARNK